MRKRRFSTRMTVLALFAMAILALAAYPCQALAQDADNDGFTDSEETDGITLCDFSVLGLNLNSPDIVVLWLPASSGNFDSLSDPFLFFERDQGGGGLGINVHLVTLSQISCLPYGFQKITETQKAVRVAESMSTPAPYPACPPPDQMVVGEGNHGSPDDLADALVYSERIRWKVECEYAAAGQSAPQDVIDDYWRHTLAHELAHNTILKRDWSNKYGYHDSPRQEKVMSKSVKYTTKGNKVTFYIGEEFADPDKLDRVLTEF